MPIIFPVRNLHVEAYTVAAPQFQNDGYIYGLMNMINTKHRQPHTMHSMSKFIIIVFADSLCTTPWQSVIYEMGMSYSLHCICLSLSRSQKPVYMSYIVHKISLK